MSDRKPIFVDWCPKDALDGMTMLTAMEELAYRRVLDLIYATDDALVDDDRRLAWVTKVGAKWKAIKASLIAMGKLEVIDGRITNGRCREVLAETHRRMAKARALSQAGVEARRRRGGPDDEPTESPHGQPSDERRGLPADEPAGQSIGQSAGQPNHHPPPIEDNDDDDGARAGSSGIDALGASSLTSGRGAPDWDGETDPTALASAIRPRDPSVIDPDPAIAEAAVMGAAMFLAARNRRWPRHTRPHRRRT